MGGLAQAAGGEDFQQDTGKLQFKSVEQFREYVKKEKSMAKLIPSFSSDIKAVSKNDIVKLAEKDTAIERTLFQKAVESWDERSMIKYRYNFTIFKD